MQNITVCHYAVLNNINSVKFSNNISRSTWSVCNSWVSCFNWQKHAESNDKKCHAEI